MTTIRLALSVLLFAGALRAQDNKPALEGEPVATIAVESTPGGVEYGVWGTVREKPAPAPILFVLAGTIDSTLSDEYFRQCGNQLAADHGYLLVSIDIPCHGSQNQGGKLSGLAGWAERARMGEDIVAESNQRLSEVLDHLIASGIADAENVAACGTSRGGFLAMHFVAHDPRVKCVAAFAPVTDPAALTEFAGLADNAMVKSLDLESRADRLAGRALWVVIGDQDGRVSTTRVIAFAQAVTRASVERKVDSRIELHVMPEPGGHRTPAGSADPAAEWIGRQMSSEQTQPEP